MGNETIFNRKFIPCMIKYLFPDNWLKYDIGKIVNSLTSAHAAILSLTNIPYQKSWVEQLQVVQLKREVAGTSKIEGADFTDRELDAAMTETAEQLYTRSQRQAAAAVKTYRWIAKLPSDRPVDAQIIKEIHRLIIAGADDDHCPPGELRGLNINVYFGIPQHRGVEGGTECEEAFNALCDTLKHEFIKHDKLIQALALHYHFAAMHPFQDGNGRTARALEALMLQNVGLRDTLFIAMSNYYYEEKNNYLRILANVRAASHDLTEFLIFGLTGIKLQCNKLFQEIKKNVSKALFKNTMFDLFNRLKSPRKRVIAERQIELLKLLLEIESCTLDTIQKHMKLSYQRLKDPNTALIRDLNYLIQLKAIYAEKIEGGNNYRIHIRLEWPTQITESEFFTTVKAMPKSKTLSFLG
jgi:Fic family protein